MRIYLFVSTTVRRLQSIQARRLRRPSAPYRPQELCFAGRHDQSWPQNNKAPPRARNAVSGYPSADVSNLESIQTAFGEAVGVLGGLDVLANPAGIHRAAVTGEITVEDWDLVFAVNVRGTMITNQEAYPYLKESGGGSIINFGSISGQRAEAKAAAYSATKGAVHAWTRSAAGAWGQDNIRVNAILPAMHTPMSRTAGKHLNEEQLNERYWRNYHGIALGRDYGDPDEDLGPVMVFMASDASHFITGQLLPVDGGQTNVR